MIVLESLGRETLLGVRSPRFSVEETGTCQANLVGIANTGSLCASSTEDGHLHGYLSHPGQRGSELAEQQTQKIVPWAPPGYQLHS